LTSSISGAAFSISLYIGTTTDSRWNGTPSTSSAPCTPKAPPGAVAGCASVGR